MSGDLNYQRVLDELRQPRGEEEQWQRTFATMDEACVRAIKAAETWRDAAIAKQMTIDRLTALVARYQAALDEAASLIPDDPAPGSNTQAPEGTS